MCGYVTTLSDCADCGCVGIAWETRLVEHTEAMNEPDSPGFGPNDGAGYEEGYTGPTTRKNLFKRTSGSLSPPHEQRKQRQKALQKMYSQIFPDGRAHVSLLTQTRLIPPLVYQPPTRTIRPDDSEITSQIMDTLHTARTDHAQPQPQITAATSEKEEYPEPATEVEGGGGNQITTSPIAGPFSSSSAKKSGGNSATSQQGLSQQTDQLLFHRTPGLHMGERVPYMQQAENTMESHRSAKKAMEYFNKIKHGVKYVLSNYSSSQGRFIIFFFCGFTERMKEQA